MKDPNEDVAFEQFRQKVLDSKPERPPEEQAAYDKNMKERAEIFLAAPMHELHSTVAFSLASMVRAVIDGALKPEDIPPTVDELLVVTYSAVSRKLLDMKPKEMLGGRA